MCFWYIHPLMDTTSDESFNYCVGKSIEIHIAYLCINEQQKNFEHCWRTGMGFPILSFSIHSWVSLLVFSVHNKEMQCTPSFWSTRWLCENTDSFLPWRFGCWHSSCVFYKIAAPPQNGHIISVEVVNVLASNSQTDATQSHLKSQKPGQ